MPRFSVADECRQYLATDENADDLNKHYRDHLGQIMQWARRDVAEIAKALRNESYMRLAAASVIGALALWLAALPLAFLITSVAIASAIIRTVNDWGSRAYVLQTYVSDQALHLHDGEIQALMESADRLGYEIRRRRNPPAV